MKNCPMIISKPTQLTLLLATLTICVSATGCLSLSFGGRTVKCEGGHSEQRVAQLESRIRTLEEYAGITPPTTKTTNIGLASVTTTTTSMPEMPVAPQPLERFQNFSTVESVEK